MGTLYRPCPKNQISGRFKGISSVLFIFWKLEDSSVLLLWNDKKYVRAPILPSFSLFSVFLFIYLFREKNLRNQVFISLFPFFNLEKELEDTHKPLSPFFSEKKNLRIHITYFFFLFFFSREKTWLIKCLYPYFLIENIFAN